jgi:predicted ATPase/DNA-binding SARP family transcriptional activator
VNNEPPSETNEPPSGTRDGLTIGVLGPLTVHRNGCVIEIAGRTQRRLLCALTAFAHQVLPADQLLEMIWPDEGASRAALQMAVARVRDKLGDSIVVSRTGGYALVTAGVTIDAQRFERAASDAKATTNTIQESLGLWRGVPFEDLDNCWQVVGYATQLIELRRTLQTRRVELLLEADETQAAVLAAVELTAGDPLNERPVGLMMRALAREGRSVDALRAYQDFRKRLAEETGLVPSAWLNAIELDLIQRRESLASNSVGIRDFPPEMSSLVGRDETVDRLEQIILSGDSRLITLTGPGGVGKTRLALRIAHKVAHNYRGGGYWVDLAPISDPSKLASTVAESLKISVGPPGELPAIVAALSGKQTLLVLDNCEHLIEAAAQLCHEVTRSCHGVVVLATSREALRLTGEWTEIVEPLGEPAVELFLQRCAAAGFQRMDRVSLRLVKSICEMVDGLPLAVEIAAAQAAWLPLAEIHRSLSATPLSLTSPLRDVRARHRSLQTAFAWSWMLLTERERLTINGCSVFVGGWTVEAAEAVLGDGVASILGSLVQRSLLRRTDSIDHGTRYDMLQTVREYAHDELCASGREFEVSRAHSLWSLQVFARCVELWNSPNEHLGSELGKLEAGNLRSGYGWAIACGDVDLALSYAKTHANCWLPSQPLNLGLPPAQAILSMPGANEHELAPYAWSVAAQGLGHDLDLMAKAVALADVEGVSLVARANPLWLLARYLVMSGRKDLAPSFVDRARRHGEDGGIAYLIAMSDFLRAELINAESEREQGLAEAQLAGERTGMASVLASMFSMRAMTATQEGQTEAGLKYATEAHRAAMRAGNSTFQRIAESLIDATNPDPSERVMLHHVASLHDCLGGLSDGKGDPLILGYLNTLANTLAVVGRPMAAVLLFGALRKAGWIDAGASKVLDEARLAYPESITRGAVTPMPDVLAIMLDEVLSVLDEKREFNRRSTIADHKPLPDQTFDTLQP